MSESSIAGPAAEPGPAPAVAVPASGITDTHQQQLCDDLPPS
jgi:hypothetical protein